MKLSSRHLQDTHRYPSYPILPEVIDIDQINDLADNAGLYIQGIPIKSSHMVLPDEEKHVCGGNLIIFPFGKNQLLGQHQNPTLWITCGLYKGTQRF